MRKLTLADIADARAYERERDALRTSVIELRRRRRVPVGNLVSVAFESRDTMRYQIQEMARAERIFTDAGIQQELDAYNPLIPEPGQLRATMFIELTSDEQVREWLPRLVGIEDSLLFRLPGLDRDGGVVRGKVAADHAGQLTRDHVTAAVHYVTFDFEEGQVAAFTDGVTLQIDHPAYHESVTLLPATVAELRNDLG
ncbi:MAG: DUF3501 family protein [Actinobacteria bacterium]|nr:DUF3501 family protein [Actinomycetota bacterium]